MMICEFTAVILLKVETREDPAFIMSVKIKWKILAKRSRDATLFLEDNFFMDELLDNLIANNSMDIALYQYLKQLRDNRTLILNDGICEEIVERIYMPLRDFERDDCQTPATLILHSQGGSVADGMFFADYLEH